MKKRVVRKETKDISFKDKLKELHLRLPISKPRLVKEEKPLEQIVETPSTKNFKEKTPEYIPNLDYKSEEKEYQRNHEGLNNMDMVIDLSYIDYFKIFYSRYLVEYEVSRQLNIWRQSNRVMARLYGLKT